MSGFAYEPETSALTILQTISALPDDFEGQSAAAQILVHPNGRYLYASNRGHESIAIFAIDQHTGKLDLLGQSPPKASAPTTSPSTPPAA